MLLGLGFEIDKSTKAGDYNQPYHFQFVPCTRIWKIKPPPKLYKEYLLTQKAKLTLGYTDGNSLSLTSSSSSSTVTHVPQKCSGFYNKHDAILCNGTIGNFECFRTSDEKDVEIQMTDIESSIQFKWNIYFSKSDPRPWSIKSICCTASTEDDQCTKQQNYKDIVFCRECTILNKEIQRRNIRKDKFTKSTKEIFQQYSRSFLTEEDAVLDSTDGTVDSPDKYFLNALLATFIKVSSTISIKNMRPVISASSIIGGLERSRVNTSGLGYNTLSARIMQLNEANNMQLREKLRNQTVLNSQSDASSKKGYNVTLFTISYCEDQPGRVKTHFICGLESISKKAEAGANEIEKFLKEFDPTETVLNAVKRGTHTTDNASVAVKTALLLASKAYGCDAHAVALARGLGITTVVGVQDGVGAITCIQLMYDIAYWWILLSYTYSHSWL